MGPTTLFKDRLRDPRLCDASDPGATFPAVLQDAASLRYVVAGSTDASPTDVVRPVDPAEFIMAPVPIGHPPPSPFPLPDAYQQGDAYSHTHTNRKSCVVLNTPHTALSVRESRWRSLLARLNDPSVPRADLAQARAQVDTQFRVRRPALVFFRRLTDQRPPWA